MVQTYSENNNIYSVDMMFAYIHLFKPEIITINIKDILSNLDYKCWGDTSKKIYYSPMDVINNIKNKKYADEVERITNADLKYPIIMDGKYIVDGMHRLSKAYILGKKTIKVYKFTKAQMKKFIIDTNINWNSVDQLKTYDYIELFYKRFCK